MVGLCFFIVPFVDARRCVASPLLYLALAAGFAFLSFDEIIGFHERITSFNRRHDFGLPMFKGTSGAWIFVYGALGLTLALLFARSTRELIGADPRSAGLFAAGFALLLSGGVLVEGMAYYNFPLPLASPVQVGGEEMLELLGASVMVAAVYRHAASAFGVLVQNQRDIDHSAGEMPARLP